MPRTIIVSDLHVDTWGAEKYGKGDRSKAKLEHWTDFLDWCSQANITELVINGDLMDAPPYEGNISFTSEAASRAVEKLLAYAKDHRVTYIYGNHDIGISGLRCLAGSALSALANINLCYPDYVLAAADTTVLLQHGHFCDPAILLYMKDLIKRTYIRSHFQAFQWVQQRRDPETGKRIQPPGVAPPTTLDLSLRPDSNVYWAMRATNGLQPPTHQMKQSATAFLRKLKEGAFHRIADSVKHYLWWEAAKHIFADYLKGARPKPKTVYSIMGHTHVPDTGTTRVRGVGCLYFNSGTWTCSGARPKDRSYATYLDLREDGVVWAQDWIWDRYEGG